MKKIIFILIFPFFLLLSCKIQQNAILDKPTKIDVASPITNQIQDMNNFRFDKIVLKLTFAANQTQHVTLEKDYVTNNADTFKTVGLKQVIININDTILAIPLVLYDDSFLENNYIYYYQHNGIYTLTTATNVYELKTPTNSELNFFGWYQDIEKTKKYFDGQNHIVELFPAWTTLEAFRVDFYIDDELFSSQMVIKGEKLSFPIVNSDFFCWKFDSKNDNLVVTEDRQIYGYSNNYSNYIVRLFDVDGNLVSIDIVPKGENYYPNLKIPQTYELYGWSEDFENLTKNINLYPIAKRVSYEVLFYSSLDNSILSASYVSYGEAATFDYYSSNYEVVSFSDTFDHVTQDLKITVYLREIYNYYYIGNLLYYVAKADEYVPNPPSKNNIAGTWEPVAGEAHTYEAKYIETGKIFHVYLPDDSVVDILHDDLKKFSFAFCLLNKTKTLKLYHTFYELNGYLTTVTPSFSQTWATEEVNLIAKEYGNTELKNALYDLSSLPLFDSTLEIYDYIAITKEVIIAPKYFDLDIKKLSFNYLSDNIIYLDDSSFQLEILNYLKNCYFIIDKNNPNYYSDELGYVYEKGTNKPLYTGGD